MADINRLVDSVAVMLIDREPPSEEALHDTVKAVANLLSISAGGAAESTFSAQEIEAAVRKLEARFDIRMGLGALFQADDYKPWLVDRQGAIDWFYWDRYRKHLIKLGYPPHVVDTLDRLTDKILDHLADPLKDGTWARKGLVVGHVQSGKTANYTGLVCKAADVGYKVIIVLAGLLNSLRNQTQARLDADFLGWCTVERRHIGASVFGTNRRPVCFTTSLEDFKRQTANAIAMGLGALSEPVVLVIKKNKRTLENLHAWLKDNNLHRLQNFPMLLVDDEADHASINVNTADTGPSAINRAIRNLLALFTRSSFVGYTATPFANIFVDPESEDAMENGELYRDLFPRDFILSLDPPDNYVGPHRLFMESSDLDCVRDIEDNEDTLPVKHPIDFIPKELPASLHRALCCFVLAISIRHLRGHVGKSHSMLVNTSRFTKVQSILAGIILGHIKQFKQSITNYAALDPASALANSDLRLLHGVFAEEFKSAGVDWPEVQSALKAAVTPLEVLIINVQSQDTLDYSAKNYPQGRSVIAVGGLGLSRGLTLEGLVTSYFLRNSIMYDTLMQMGRWFGYRDGYQDICRIFMTPTASSWYAHIAEATEELRRDFKAMETAKLTPKDFGLRVRSHPTALIVTARNKMRSGKRVPMQIALEGRLAETSVLLGNDDAIRSNKLVLDQICEKCAEQAAYKHTSLGFLWKNVDRGYVTTAIESFQNHPECIITYREPLIQYINWLGEEFDTRFDVLLRSVAGIKLDCNVNDLRIARIRRRAASIDSGRIEINKRRVGSKGDERAGLEDVEVEAVKTAAVKAGYDEDNIPDKLYRKVAGRNPLFIIYHAVVQRKNDQKPEKEVSAYSVSFPGDPGSARRPSKLVEYVVNTTWWEQNFESEEDPPEEVE